MFAGLDMKGSTLTSATLTWDFIKRVKDVTSMKVMIKSLESGDDAALAVSSGADGIIVSNHGGRATDVFKARALGAFGQPGVERVLQILGPELRLAMVGCGTTSLSAITATSLIDTRR